LQYTARQSAQLRTVNFGLRHTPGRD
jgi:hypothetical protein